VIRELRGVEILSDAVFALPSYFVRTETEKKATGIDRKTLNWTISVWTKALLLLGDLNRFVQL